MYDLIQGSVVCISLNANVCYTFLMIFYRYIIAYVSPLLSYDFQPFLVVELSICDDFSLCSITEIFCGRPLLLLSFFTITECRFYPPSLNIFKNLHAPQFSHTESSKDPYIYSFAFYCPFSNISQKDALLHASVLN